MNSNDPKRKAETRLEYAIYAAILGMTVSCTFMYMTLSGDLLFASFKNYLVFAYIAFLALAFSQLNKLHRKRRSEASPPISEPVKTPARGWTPPLGLTRRQLTILAFVFVTACVTFTWALSVLR